MLEIRRISSSRWWHKKKSWIFFGIFLFLVFVRISKGSLYKDFFYFISKPFWPGQFQKEVILKSIDQESLIKLNLLGLNSLELSLFEIHQAKRALKLNSKNLYKEIPLIFLRKLKIKKLRRKPNFSFYATNDE